MAVIKYSKKNRRVVLELTLTEARYVYSALNKVGPSDPHLFAPEKTEAYEYHDPIYDKMTEVFEAEGISLNVGLARTTSELLP